MGTVIFLDSELRAATQSVRTAMLNALPEPSECATDFSPRFLAKMEKLSATKKRTAAKPFLRAAAAVLAIAVFTASVLFAANPQAYADFKKWIREIYEGQHIYKFFGEADRSKRPEYTFGWLPDGWKITQEEHLQTMSCITAKSGDDMLFLTYSLIDDGMEIVITEKDVVVEKVKIGQLDADYYDGQAAGVSNSLVWIDGDMSFSMDANLDKETMLRIAENIKK